MKDYVHVKLFKEHLRNELNNYADDVATGVCADFAAYKELCGVIRGLALAERLLIDLAHEIDEDDE